MPRDSKTPLIQKIARQALVTFKGLTDNQDQLVSLVTAVRAADLKMTPRKCEPGAGAAELQGPPVTYMHICETEVFSMGVFLLRSGASIPLHDHPDMNGMLKVLYGKVSVRCFDKREGNLTLDYDPPRFDPPLAPPQTASVWRSVLRSVAEYSETSGPCLLTPLRDNLHQIAAVEGPAAFLDILAPPYDPDSGRDCHYYRVLQTAGERGTGGEGQQQHGGGGGGETTKDGEAWLLEVPQPEDFWCGGEPYPGPAVSI